LLAPRRTRLAVLEGAAAPGVRLIPRAMLLAAGAGLALVLSGCTSPGGPAAEQADRQNAVITIGSFDFPESVLLAQVYGQALVATAATAERYGLRSIADLAAVAPKLVFGGPPECPDRAYCLRGLQRAYGLRFKAFVRLDAGGPLTLQALRAGDIAVALLFTT